MKKYTCSIIIVGIEANNKEEAERTFWEIVDNSDYECPVTVEEEK